jgi:DNA-3-methyladenine glycosylase II
VLGASVASYGPPPLWSRPATYSTLVHLILEQQVSLASAQAAFDRLATALGGEVTPSGVQGLDEAQMRSIGFSRQKTAYARDLAAAMLNGFALDALTTAPDDDVRRALIAHRGIGRWTADIYLTMCLLRPDVWPRGDLALATAAVEIGAAPSRPTEDELEALASAWAPHRAVAARILWHHYLRTRNLPVD